MAFKSKYKSNEIEQLLDQVASDGITIVDSVDDLDPNAEWGTIAKVESVEYNSVKFSQLPYVKLEDLNPDGTIKDADRFPRVTNLDLNTGIAADWGDFDYCFLIPRNIDNTSPFDIIMLHPEYEYGGEESWVCYFPNISKGQGVSTDNDGCIWIYNKTPGSTEATFRYFNIGWNIQNIIPKDLTFEQVLAAGDYVMAAPAVLGVTGLCDYMDADDYNIAGISAQLELEVIDKYYLAVIESTFSELYIKKDTWIPLSSGGIDIVDSVDKLDPSASPGTLAAVVAAGGIKTVKASELPLPNAYIYDPNTGFIDAGNCPKIEGLSINETIQSNYFGLAPEITFVSHQYDWSNGSSGKFLCFFPMDQNDSGEEWYSLGFYYCDPDTGEDIEDTLCTFTYSNGSYITNTNQEYWDKINSVITDMYYIGSTYIFDRNQVTQNDFSAYDTIFNITAKLPATADIYLKQENWKSLLDVIYSNLDLAFYKFDDIQNQVNNVWNSVYDLRDIKSDRPAVQDVSGYLVVNLSPNKYYYTCNAQQGKSCQFILIDHSNTYLSEYIIEINCTSTPQSLTFKYKNSVYPSVVWANGIPPTFEAGYKYIVSIVNGLAVFMQFPNS